MERRKLGRTGLQVSRLALGCVTFGREIDEEASFRVLDYAREKGIQFLDTAEAYGGGQARQYRRRHLGVEDVREVSGEMSSSERILGRWLRSRGCRKEVVICTKVSTGGAAENISKALGGSLERLETDYVDLYEMHSADAATPIAETLSALSEAVAAGRVRSIGCSNYSAAQLREALETSRRLQVPRFEVIQNPYSLIAREAEGKLFPLCVKEEVGITTYSPLAAGFMAGKYTADRSAIPTDSRFGVIPGHADIYFSDRNFQILERLRLEAQAREVPMVRLAMAYALTHPQVDSVLIGARTIAHVDNALKTLGTELEPEVREEMSAW